VNRSFRATWVRLRSRNIILAAFGGLSLFAALVTAIVVTTASGSGPRGGPPGPGTGITPARLASSHGAIDAVTQATPILGVLALAIFAYVAASEYSTGMIRNLLVREPRRSVLYAGSYLALVSLTILAATAATIVGVTSATAFAPVASIDTSAWFTGEGIRAIMSGGGNLAIALVGYGTIGYGLGSLLRSPTPTVAIGVVWLLPFETILQGTVKGSVKWLPGQLLSAVAQGGTANVGFGRALFSAAAVVSVIWLAALLRFRAADITA
jgi:ABC-2 type transport system permease protein